MVRRACRVILITLILLPLPARAATCPDLSPELARRQIEQLTAEVRYHNRLYEQELRPVIGDGEYDALFARLAALEGCYPQLVRPDSPTRRVGSDDIAPKLTVVHVTPMLSLESSATMEKVDDLFMRLGRDGDATLLVQPKVDGVPLELVYRERRLVSAATRGNGERGEDVTAVARLIAAIPQALPATAPPVVTVRGELFARRDNPAAGDYATLRHQAAAALRATPPAPALLAALGFFPFAWTDAPETSDLEALRCLAAWGFPVDPALTRTVATRTEIRTLYGEYLARRNALPFAADGIVVKVDSLLRRRELGETGHAPRWAAAWKFPAATAETRIEAIDWSLGRSGRQTPVARIVPVRLNNIAVANVSLHSAEALQQTDVAVGDTVLVALTGDAVPQIVAVLYRPANRLAVAAPARPDEPCYRLSDACSERFLARLVHFASPDGLNLAGFGPQRLKNLVESGKIASLSGLFSLKSVDLASLPGVGDRTADRLAATLAAARHPQPYRLLAALGIDGAGPSAIRKLEAAGVTLPTLLVAESRDLAPIIGAHAAGQLMTSLQDADLRQELLHLQQQGLW